MFHKPHNYKLNIQERLAYEGNDSQLKKLLEACCSEYAELIAASPESGEKDEHHPSLLREERRKDAINRLSSNLKKLSIQAMLVDLEWYQNHILEIKDISSYLQKQNQRYQLELSLDGSLSKQVPLNQKQIQEVSKQLQFPMMHLASRAYRMPNHQSTLSLFYEMNTDELSDSGRALFNSVKHYHEKHAEQEKEKISQFQQEFKKLRQPSESRRHAQANNQLSSANVLFTHTELNPNTLPAIKIEPPKRRSGFFPLDFPEAHLKRLQTAASPKTGRIN